MHTYVMDRVKKMWRQQHPVFPGGHPSKYWLGSTLLNFSDRTRTGVFSVIWPLAKAKVQISKFEAQVEAMTGVVGAPQQVAPPVRWLQLWGQIMACVSLDVAIWWFWRAPIFSQFSAVGLQLQLSLKISIWGDNCVTPFQWPWQQSWKGGLCFDLCSASLLGLLAKIKV